MNTFENVQANRKIVAKFSDSKKRDKKEEKVELLVTQIKQKDLGIDFVHQENEFDDFEEEILLPHKLSQNGPFSAVQDVNGDGLEDLFIGGAANQSGVLYTQNESGQFIKSVSQPWENDKASEDMGCIFIDVDGDNDFDLYIASGGNEFKAGNQLLKDRLYINNGEGQFVRNSSALPNITQSSQCVSASDIDNDGDLDLFVGTRLIARQYTYPATSYLLINENGNFKKAKSETVLALSDIGMVTDAVFTDVDSDGDEDLMIVGEWMEIKVLINTDGVFEDQSDYYGLSDTRGMWWSITAGDLDGDGDDDYVIGNLGKNNKFKATEEHPFKVYANDFDNNGTNDIVLAKFYKDDYVPLRGRECTSQQMPYVGEKFEDYHSFASSTLIDILPEDKVDDAVVYEIKSFESIILINDNGKLVKKSLPNEVQISPIKSTLIFDINKDGYQDIITVGNHYGVEVETQRYDAGFGAVLLGDGKANFNYSSPIATGFYVPYDSREVKKIGLKERDLILVTNNNAELTIFSLKR
ncbi:MAG: hypothetical protein ACJARX_001696 [Psychroserpens sp.]|jgi:hypothetical protein